MAKMEINDIKKIAEELVEKYNLDMKIVACEYGEDRKVIITYVCEDRVDFRELVKDLANNIHHRIELKQIGVRDYAKRVGGIGICGKECCCKEYLNNFDKVSVKMAKTQGLSLNPIKISGVCGRLMCCLSFEDGYYQEMSAKMPKINSTVSTPDGVGVVVYLDFLRSKVSVKFVSDGDSKIVDYLLDEIKNVDRQSRMEEKKLDKSKHTKISDNQTGGEAKETAFGNTHKQKLSIDKHTNDLNEQKADNGVRLQRKDNRKFNPKHKNKARKGDKNAK